MSKTIEEIEEALTCKDKQWAAAKMKEGYTVKYNQPSKDTEGWRWKLENNSVLMRFAGTWAVWGGPHQKGVDDWLDAPASVAGARFEIAND